MVLPSSQPIGKHYCCRVLSNHKGFALPSKVQLNQIITQLLTAKDDAKVHIGECEIAALPIKCIYLKLSRPHASC